MAMTRYEVGVATPLRCMKCKNIITLSGSGTFRMHRRISSHIRFRSDLKNSNLVHPCIISINQA